MTRLVFADVETTGTDPSRHHLWELALVVRDDTGPDDEYCWQVPADLSTADPAALRIGQYYWRNTAGPDYAWTIADAGADATDVPQTSADTVANIVAGVLAGAVLVAANVSFDAAFIDKFLRTNGQAPAWDYHLVEIESMAGGASGALPPWKFNQFLDAYGITVPEGRRHTALGDALAVRDLYDAIRNGKPAV